MNEEIDYLVLLKYISYFENGLDSNSDNYYGVLQKLNRDSHLCLEYYPDLNRASNGDKYLAEVYKNSGEDSGDYFSMDVSNKDAKTIIALINMMFSSDRWSGSLISSLVDEGYVLKWLKRLKEISEIN